MAEVAPRWLTEMRAISGIVETPGSGNNPKIMAMADTIAEAYPEMASYCAGYRADATPWCGLAVAYCLTKAGVRPPFGAKDTDRFLWARSFDETVKFGLEITKPRLGCIVVLSRQGGGHVTLYESTSDSGSNYMCRGGNQSDAINLKPFPIKDVVALIWPREADVLPNVPDVIKPPTERRVLKKGDSGAEVSVLQKALGIPADGEYGSLTEAAVEGFQAGADLAADGVCGEQTWAKVDSLVVRKAAGSDGLSVQLQDAIIAIAEESALIDHSWKDRGKAPHGYIYGMCLCYALALTWLAQGDSAAALMAQADRNNADTDALTWHRAEFAKLDMANSASGTATLRHLFVMMIGLGMRESSGRYSAGLDMSAGNTTAVTAEAGLFQTSWNIKTVDPAMDALFEMFTADPNGFLEDFQKGVLPKADELGNYGTGDGATYQWLAKYCPAFAVMTTAIGLRLRRKHWGPINRKEVELIEEADDLLLAVEELVMRAPPVEPPEKPDPPPVIEQAEVTITIKATGNVKVNIVEG